jgi:hypothetical protein
MNFFTFDFWRNTMKKLALLALVLLLVPGFALAADCVRDGDPAFYVDFGEDTHDMIAGETYCWTVGPCNFGFVSATCPDPDTFCVYAYDTAGWTIVGDPPLEDCYLLDPGYLWWQDICITAPCEVVPCDYNTLTIVMTWCDDTLACRHDCNPPEAPCEDPNWYGGNPYYSTDVVTIHIVESPPALYIVQDSVYYVEQGQTAAYVPFTICNGDACADPTVYNYTISCTPIVGSLCTGFPQAGSTAPVPGGECQDVYGVVDASLASIGDKASLEIIAWDITGAVYDTCVQIVEVVEQQPVPLFTAPVVTILVLAMILAAAVFMKRRATSRA